MHVPSYAGVSVRRCRLLGRDGTVSPVCDNGTQAMIDTASGRLLAAQASADPYLDEKEAARLLGTSTRTLQRHRQHNTGPAYFRPSPRRVVYRLSGLIQWARAREQGGKNAAR